MNKDFGMFTDTGEELVSELVRLSGTYALSDSTIKALLKAISTEEAFAEATDTVVRDRVFAYLNRASW